MAAGVALVWGSGRNHPSISAWNCPSSFGREDGRATSNAPNPNTAAAYHSLAALTDNNKRNSIAMRAQQHGAAVVGAPLHREGAAGRVSSRVSSQHCEHSTGTR